MAPCSLKGTLLLTQAYWELVPFGTHPPSNSPASLSRQDNSLIGIQEAECQPVVFLFVLISSYLPPTPPQHAVNRDFTVRWEMAQLSPAGEIWARKLHTSLFTERQAQFPTHTQGHIQARTHTHSNKHTGRHTHTERADWRSHPLVHTQFITMSFCCSES